ncbi:hypothetical protein MKW92_018994, partial [Papaver armeniacum]
VAGMDRCQGLNAIAWAVLKLQLLDVCLGIKTQVGVGSNCWLMERMDYRLEVVSANVGELN